MLARLGHRAEEVVGRREGRQAKRGAHRGACEVPLGQLDHGQLPCARCVKGGMTLGLGLELGLGLGLGLHR